MSNLCIIVTIVVYLAAMLLVGFAYSKSNNDSTDFYLGGRKMGPLVTAMSAEASDMSSWLLMGMPGLAYLSGIASPGWTAIGLALGTWLNWLIVARRLRRYSADLNAITVPQFLSLRFHDQRNLLNALGAVIIIVFFVPYTASGFAACGKLFNSLFGWDYMVAVIIGAIVIISYTSVGGFSAVATMDLIQSIIMTVALAIIVVFGVVGGVFTATESAAIAVIYSLLVSVFVYKGLDWKGVWHALDECVNTLSIVLILIATSAVFGNCLTMLHVPDLAANAITSVTDNPYIIALLIDVIILVLGCIMDMAPIILIATPILLPIATSIGIDPIQFGIIVVLNCGIGLLTPPVGAVLFIGSAVAKRPMEKVVKATLPFYLCMFIALLLLTFIPDISLAIPKLLGGYVSPITNPLGPVFIH